MTVKITLVFLILHALVWCGFAVICFSGMFPELPGSRMWIRLMGGISAAVGLVFFLLVIFLQKHPKSGFYAAVVMLTAAVLVNVLDDIGLMDLAYLALALIPLILLLMDAKWYIQK